MQNIFIDVLPPWVETGLQPAFYDLESGTVLQQTARMYAKVRELTEAFNTFSTNVTNEINQFEQDTNDEIERFEGVINDTVEEYIGKFNELHDYVEDYFENLDVQEEINNKLDDMVENGTLYEIINSYLPYIYVENYGALGDGITDDTQAFQDALDYASTVGGCIKLLNKTYVVSNLTITGHISIIGDGQEQSILKVKDGTEGNIITSSEFGRLYLHLADFKIDGNKENAPDVTAGIYIDRGAGHADASDSFITVERLLISKIAGDGIYNGPGGRENRFINCVVEYCGGYGINSVSSDSYFEGITCKLNTKSGIRVGSTACRFINIKCFLNGYQNETESREDISGFLVDGYNNLFTSCDAQENYGDGFYIKQGPNNFINCIADANGFKSQRYNPDNTYADMTDEELVYDGFHIPSLTYYVRLSQFIVMVTDHRRAAHHQLQRYGVFMGNCQTCTFNISGRDNVELYHCDSTYQINKDYYGANNMLVVNGVLITTQMMNRAALQNSASTRNAIDIFTDTDNTRKARVTTSGTTTLQVNNMNSATYVDTPLAVSLNTNNTDGSITLGDSGQHYTVNMPCRGLSFFGVSPVAQGLHYSNATDATSAVTLINNIKAQLEAFGLFASS